MCYLSFRNKKSDYRILKDKEIIFTYAKIILGSDKLSSLTMIFGIKPESFISPYFWLRNGDRYEKDI